MDIKKRTVMKKPQTKGSKNVLEAQKLAVGSTVQTTEKENKLNKKTINVVAEDLLFQRKKLAVVQQGNAIYLKRLIHIKGKKKPFARLVEC